MALHGMLICVLILSHVTVIWGALDALWDNDIFTGRQWEGMITQTKVFSPRVIRAALLVMYEPRCVEDMVKTDGLIPNEMPLNQYMIFGQYDTVNTLKHIWYDIDERDNLTERYNPQNCPEYLYFATNASILAPQVYSRNSGILAIDWLWGKFAIAFTIENDKEDDVLVEIMGQRKHMNQQFVLKSKDVKIIRTFVSNIVLVSDKLNRQFLCGMVIEPEVTSLKIQNNMEFPNAKNSWYRAKQQEMQKQSQETRTWIWRIAGNYLRNFKQPLLLPIFTKEGYYKTQIPETLYKEIMNFYRENVVNRKHEPDLAEPLINERDVRCTIVALSPEMVEHIGVTLKSLLEQWSNVKLELTRLYGIREYYTGNILRNHVDRVHTHVISAILQIDQEMDGQPPWELEVITRDGKRKHTALKPGEMLFYESATIIHGRPLPFQGKWYANAFLHYRPAENWSWDMHPDGHWITNQGHPKDIIDQLITPVTEAKAKVYYHDEL